MQQTKKKPKNTRGHRKLGNLNKFSERQKPGWLACFLDDEKKMADIGLAGGGAKRTLLTPRFALQEKGGRGSRFWVRGKG